MINCSIQDCDRPKLIRGWCTLHYQHWKRQGDPLAVLHRHGSGDTPEIRFWSRVVKGNPDQCWEWQGCVGSHGYGAIQINKRKWLTHRYAYYLTTGKDSTLHILHSCDNRRCVNPAHLREGTNTENVQDAVDRGRTAKGERNGGAKLKEWQVIEIKKRLATGESPTSIAPDYYTDPRNIYRIKQGVRWTHVKIN